MTTKKSTPLKPLYLILSEQPFLQAQALKRLRARFEDHPDFQFNFDQFDGANVTGSEVVASANTLPFGPPLRLVLVTGAESLNAAAQAEIAEYANDPSPTTVLALVGTKLPKTSALYKRFAKHGDVLHREAPKRRELGQAVVGMCRDVGLECGYDVAEALINSVGEDLDAISAAIHKVRSYTGERTTATREDVAAVVGVSAEVKVWEFANALANRDGRTAFVLLDRMLDQGNTVYAAQALATRTVRDLLTARVLLDRGDGTAALLAQELGRQEWLARKTLDQAKRFTAQELRDALRSMAEVEYAMKTSRDARLAFEKWVLSVCR